MILNIEVGFSRMLKESAVFKEIIAVEEDNFYRSRKEAL